MKASLAFEIMLYNQVKGWVEPNMQVTMDIPDEIARLIDPEGGNISRELLEAFAVEAYREEKLSRGQISELLGLNFWETEKFLKQREAYLHYDLSDLEHDRESLKTVLPK